MKLPNSLHRQFQETLRNQLIPWANSSAPFILMDAPPRMIGTFSMSERPGTALPMKHGDGQNMRFRYWKDQNMNSSSIPYLGCVVEGEADQEVGITTAESRKRKISGTRWIVQIPKGSFFLYPPGIPYSGGGDVHWKRPHPEKAYSRIFWMHILESGANCHFSTSDKGKLWSHPNIFIPGNQLYAVAQNMIREMQEEPPQYVPLLYHQLGLLLNYTLRNLLIAAKTPALMDDVSLETRLSPRQPASTLVERALAYIDENLHDRQLTVEKIAAQIHISATHLNRLFQQELHSSVKALVIKRRMENGAKLLVESSLTVNQIYGMCGYYCSPPFIRAFVSYFGVSPTQYRLSHKNQ